MHWIDLSIFIIYMIAMLGIGYIFLLRNKDPDDYYVGGRKMGSLHIGLSVVATDVGGGFSIGLGGLGFIIGLSGSWMLFTGLVGAWIASVILIPRIYKIGQSKKLHTFPQILKHYYNPKVALIAGLISAIGYIGFTSSQILAGAKLASASFVNLDQQTALILMGTIAVIYTVLGGLKAVIYTDTVQWIVLMAGLVFIGIPMGYHAIGGMESIRSVLSKDFLTLTNLQWQDIVKWAVTIIPIWFVGMTLYQRIFACKDIKTAKKAWYIAGIFEWPFMAFMGVVLGLFARVAFENGMFAELGIDNTLPIDTDGGFDSEKGLPMLLRSILPVGLMGLMMSAYFSAIMSTADSCLMAASGNISTDIFSKYLLKGKSVKSTLKTSQVLTLVIGILAILLASYMENVLNLMLYSYAFMVSGLFVPVLASFILKKPKPEAAITAMVIGGATTVILTTLNVKLPFGLDPNIFGISASALSFIIVNFTISKTKTHAN